MSTNEISSEISKSKSHAREGSFFRLIHWIVRSTYNIYCMLVLRTVPVHSGSNLSPKRTNIITKEYSCTDSHIV